VIRHVEGTGILHRIHPLTAFGLAVSISTSVFVAPPPLGPVAVLAGTVILAVVSRLPSALGRTVVVSVPFWGFLLLIHGLLRHDPGRAVVIGSRVSTVILVFAAVVTAVQPARLVDALAALRAPFSVGYVFSATLLVVPRLRDRARAISEAQQCRGLRVAGSPLGRIRAVVPLTVPLVLSALSEVDERAVALATRGVGGRAVRTVLHPPNAGGLDVAMGILGVGILVGSFFWRVG